MSKEEEDDDSRFSTPVSPMAKRGERIKDFPNIYPETRQEIKMFIYYFYIAASQNNADNYYLRVLIPFLQKYAKGIMDIEHVKKLIGMIRDYISKDYFNIYDIKIELVPLINELVKELDDGNLIYELFDRITNLLNTSISEYFTNDGKIYRGMSNKSSSKSTDPSIFKKHDPSILKMSKKTDKIYNRYIGDVSFYHEDPRSDPEGKTKDVTLCTYLPPIFIFLGKELKRLYKGIRIYTEEDLPEMTGGKRRSRKRKTKREKLIKKRFSTKRRSSKLKKKKR
jgi:hypothetical protein